MFYNATDKLKAALYGIGDTVKDTVISRAASHQDGVGDLRLSYRKMFTDFGRSVAADYAP